MLKRWLEKYNDDFEGELFQNFHSFIDSCNDSEAVLLTRVLEVVEKKVVHLPSFIFEKFVN